MLGWRSKNRHHLPNATAKSRFAIGQQHKGNGWPAKLDPRNPRSIGAGMLLRLQIALKNSRHLSLKLTAVRGQMLVDATGLDTGGEHRIALRCRRLAALARAAGRHAA
jgi:hypothetical protein